MKNKSIITLGLILLITSCLEKKSEKEEKHVEPFSIEYFEVKKSTDTNLVIYFNRNVTKNDVALRITPIFMQDSIHNLPPKQLIFALKKSRNRIIEIPYPIQVTPELLRLNSEQDIKEFNEQFTLQISGINPFSYISLIPDFPNCPDNRILANGERLYWSRDILYFKPEKSRPSLKINDIDKGFIWRPDYFRYYKGQLDNKGRKTGNWTWSYSNGNILATAKFNCDTVLNVLKIYSFKGHLIDSIPESKIHGKNW